MKFTVSWLQDHLETAAPLAALVAKLSAIGLEVEGIEDKARDLAPFKVARVTATKKHPNADKLQVALVEVEPGVVPVEVVCGAPNCRPGMLTVFAPLGTRIPGSGLVLEKKPVRGIVSNGMLCSAQELGIEGEASGILDLDAVTFGEAVGRPYAAAAGLNDPVIEVKLTPNRPDCTGVRGIARDLAAAGMGRLRPEPELMQAVEGDYACPVAIRLEFDGAGEPACPVFAGRYIRGVRNGPSPAWLQARLKAVGARCINAAVDVTNYISLDRGRPLHVYDADTLQGGVCARMGKAGERFCGLDGREHEAGPSMCVIADDSGPLGFGGILGGVSTSCTEATRNILIESAWFEPHSIAATGRTAGIQSDARYRFERGVDPRSVRPGLDLATDMIVGLIGGAPSKASQAGAAPAPLREIVFDPARVEKLSGIAIDAAESLGILLSLGFAPSEQAHVATAKAGASAKGKPEPVLLSVPSWRPDVHGPADLVEEVVRIAGLERIPATPMARHEGIARPVLTEVQGRLRRARRTLAARGLVEAVTWSFVPLSEAVMFGGGGATVQLANPISVELSTMRPSLLPGLLAATHRNLNRAMHDFGLFEVGAVFAGDRPEDQTRVAAGVRAGAAKVTGAGRHWQGAATAAGVFDAKADCLAVLAAFGFDGAKAQVSRDAPAWFHPGRSGTLRLGPKLVLAHFGEVHPATLKAFGIDGPVAAFEVFVDAVPGESRRGLARVALKASDLLPVRRDLAFTVQADVAADAVLKAAQAADKALIAGANVFDVFEGGQLKAEGRKSVAIEVVLQPIGATLTDAEIEAVVAKIIAGVGKATGGEIRG